MPMFGARTCTATDGHICGIGVRVRAEYFLASNRAMAEVNLGLNLSNSPFGAPGVFKFNAPLEIDISQINKDGWQWAPQHVKTYQGDIGLYRAAVRSSARHDVANNVQWIPEAKDRHPLATPVRLETELNKSLSPCKLITYGAKEYASDCIKRPNRKLTAIRVEKAPIVCGEGSQETVQFIVGHMPANLVASDGRVNVTATSRLSRWLVMQGKYSATSKWTPP